MMKNKVSAVIGVLLVFVIGAAFLVFCRISEANAPQRAASDYYDDDYYDDYDEDYEDEEVTDQLVPVLEKRGYTASGKLPECAKKLVDTGFFEVTEEKIRQEELDEFDGYEGDELLEYYEEMYADEDEYEDEEDVFTTEELLEMIEEDKKDLRKSLKEGYQDALKDVVKWGEAKYLQKYNDLFVTKDEDYDEDEYTGLYCLLKWDAQTGECVDAERIATIEGCGFQGFSGLIAEVGQQVKAEMAESAKYEEYYKKEYGEEEDEDEEDGDDVSGYFSENSFLLYSQGVTFLLYNFSDTGYATLELMKNNSMFYTPAKYQNIIDGIAADGNYFLISSYVAGGKDILVFRRDNTVFLRGDEYEDEDDYYDYSYLQEGINADPERRKYNNKRLVLIFEDGKMVDYYMTSPSANMQLDDADKQVLDAYVSGLGKTLSGVPETLGGQKYLYRAK